MSLFLIFIYILAKSEEVDFVCLLIISKFLKLCTLSKRSCLLRMSIHSYAEKNPVISGVDDSKAHFEVKVEAHEKCTNKDVIEVIQENFFGTLDQKHVGKTDPIRHLIIREEKDELLEIPVQGKYRIVVRDDKLATDIVALWNEPYEFDDLAFKNAIYDKIKIKIKEVKRVR